jgi:hypothetical protein
MTVLLDLELEFLVVAFIALMLIFYASANAKMVNLAWAVRYVSLL